LFAILLLTDICLLTVLHFMSWWRVDWCTYVPLKVILANDSRMHSLMRLDVYMLWLCSIIIHSNSKTVKEGPEIYLYIYAVCLKKTGPLRLIKSQHLLITVPL